MIGTFEWVGTSMCVAQRGYETRGVEIVHSRAEQPCMWGRAHMACVHNLGVAGDVLRVCVHFSCNCASDAQVYTYQALGLQLPSNQNQ
jgi:hypothetical protein